MTVLEWILAVAVPIAFVGGILFDRWMNGEPRKYREAHKRYGSGAGHDAVLPPEPADEAARLRAGRQLGK